MQLKELGELVVLPHDARPLKELKRRGWIRYRRDEDGVRIAVLKAKLMRKHCPWKAWDWWPGAKKESGSSNTTTETTAHG